MRSIKVLGLGAFAAMAAMALVGASSAMAEETQLCKKHEEPCGAGNAVGKQILHLKANELWLLHGLNKDGSGTDILCLAVLSEVDYGSLAAPAGH